MVNAVFVPIVSGNCWFCESEITPNYVGVLFRKKNYEALALCTDCIISTEKIRTEYVAERSINNDIQLALNWLPK